MEDFRLPKDLSRLEQELAARAIPEPSPELRDRVVAAIRQESIEMPTVGLAGTWRFAAAVAAVLLLLLNVSMSAANHADWDVWGRPQQQDTASVARKLRETVPELSEREALRLACSMQSTSPLIPAVRPKEHSGWWLALK